MDPKQLVLANFDKAILAGFAVWTVFSTTGYLKKPADLAKGETIHGQLQKITEHMKGSTVEEPKDPGWQGTLRAQLDCQTVASTKAFPAWLMERRPYFLYYVRPNTETFSAKHRPPTDIAGDGSARGRVVVRWKPSIENEYVICNFEVMRRQGDAGEWQKVYDASPGTSEFTDTRLASRSKYFYKVVSVAAIDQDAPAVSKHGLTLPAEETRKESAECGPFETARDVFVMPVSVTAVTDADLVKNPDAKESAYVRVYKWDPETSMFQKKTFTVAAGAAIGELASLGRGKKFDFTTGAVLDDVWVELRRNPTLGNDQEVHWVRIRFADGTTDQFNDAKTDRPPELGAE